VRGVPPTDQAWNPPPLSTTNSEALDRYHHGITALVAGLSDAEELLDEATVVDPGFFLAHLAVTVARAAAGRPYTMPSRPPLLSRGERQHAEIIEAHLAGHTRRAADLRREHLLEYPGDLLIVWLPRS
jgi:DNA-binding GntR family transcriptional regulator